MPTLLIALHTDRGTPGPPYLAAATGPVKVNMIESACPDHFGDSIFLAHRRQHALLQPQTISTPRSLRHHKLRKQDSMGINNINKQYQHHDLYVITSRESKAL
jgi:hypothetical protein